MLDCTFPAACFAVSHCWDSPVVIQSDRAISPSSDGQVALGVGSQAHNGPCMEAEQALYVRLLQGSTAGQCHLHAIGFGVFVCMLL